MKTVLAILAVLLGLVTDPLARAADPREIVLGVFPGPYAEMARKGIEPGLEARGYKVTVKEMEDPVMLYTALAEGAIHANLVQDSAYLAKFSFIIGRKLSPIITVPTRGAGLYSRRVKSVAELKAGDELVVARDSKHLARHLHFLQEIGLITLRRGADPAKVSEMDIGENPKRLVIRLLWSHEVPRALDSVAAAVVDGDEALATNIPLGSAIAIEQLHEKLAKVIAVRAEDLDKPFVKDIKAVVEGPGFRKVIDDPKGIFNAYRKPGWMK